MADDDARARRTTKATAGGPAKKAAPRKVAAKETPAPATAAKRAPVRKAAVTKAAAAKVAKAPARKAPAAAKVTNAARKAPAAQVPATDRGSLLTPRKKAPPPLRLAAEQTFDDDWEPPAPEPVREDPAARVRAILRQAALSLEGSDAPAPPRPAPPLVAQPESELEEDEEEDEDEEREAPVTRVLVAPTAPDLEEEDFEEDLEEEALDEEEALEDEELADDDEDFDDDEDWAPPEVLDDAASVMSTSSDPAPPPPPLSPPLPLSAPTTHQPATEFTPPPPPPPKPEKRRGRRRLVRALLVVLIVIAVVGAGAYAFARIRDDGVDYSKLKVGDCFDSSATNEVRGVKVKPCSEAHNSEIFFLVTHPGGADAPYPGKDALVQFAADACLGKPLTEYLGVPLEQSQLKDFEIVPQESAWKDDGRRVLVCGLDTGGEGTLTGSVKGTRR